MIDPYRVVVLCDAFLILWCSIVIVVHRWLFSSVCRLVCSRVIVGDVASSWSIDVTFGTTSCQVRGSIYHAYNFQLTVPSSRIEQLLDPTTYILASHMKTQTAMYLHIPANHVLLCYYFSLLSPCLVCMLWLYSLLSCLSLGWLSHCYILFVDNMIFIIMLTIFDEGWKV